MISLVILSVLIGLPILLLLVLRSNAAIVFLALCAGVVLYEYIGPDASFTLSLILPRVSIVVTEVLNISIVLLPATVTLVALRKKMSGVKLILNIVPAVAVGALIALSVVPLLSPITRDNITRSHIWNLIYDVRGLVVGAGTLFSVLLLRSNHGKEGKGRGKSHK